MAQLYFYSIDINQIRIFRLPEGIGHHYQTNPLNPILEGRLHLALFGPALFLFNRYQPNSEGIGHHYQTNIGILHPLIPISKGRAVLTLFGPAPICI